MRPIFRRTRYWKPRFTIGGLMLTIVAIALLLTALKPLAGFAESAYPALGRVLNEISTPETGIVLSCMAIGAFVVFKLMSLDEK